MLHVARPGGLQVGPAEARSKKSELVISVENAIVATIIARPDGEVLRGTATLGEPGSQVVAVEIHIEQGGARMVAIPAGFRSLERWIFERP